MLKKTITYKDLDGNELTEDFYFNLTAAELAEMELSHQGGMKEYLEGVVKSEHGGLIMQTFKDIIRQAYGVRSANGKSFLKTDEGWIEFLGSDAYNQLFMELVTNADKAAEFVVGIMPADLAEQAKDIQDHELPDNPTRKELTDMSREELLAAFKAKNSQ